MIIIGLPNISSIPIEIINDFTKSIIMRLVNLVIDNETKQQEIVVTVIIE